MKKILKLCSIISLLLVFISLISSVSMAGSIIPSPSTSAAGCSTLPSLIRTTIEGTEPWYCQINSQIGNTFTKEAPLMWIAVLISFAIASIIYMAGALTGNSRIKNFGIGEIFEAAASGIIVLLFLYVCAVIFGILPGLTVGPINPYPTALNLITATVSESQTLYSSLFTQYIKDKYYYSMSLIVGGSSTTIFKLILKATNVVNIALEIGQFVVTFFFLDPAMALMNIISDGIFILWAEYFLLVFFSIASIPVFLVPGIIFRSIFPTRALGGMLMAIAITFYLIVPILFAIAFYFTAPSVLQNLTTASVLLNKFGANQGSITNALTPASPLILQVQQIKNAMASYWLLLLFYPVLIIVIAYAAINQLASFLGGAARLGGKMRGFI